MNHLVISFRCLECFAYYVAFVSACVSCFVEALCHFLSLSFFELCTLRTQWHDFVALPLAAETVFLQCSHLTSFWSVSSSPKPKCVHTTDTAFFLGTSCSCWGVLVGSVLVFLSLMPPACFEWTQTNISLTGRRRMTERNIQFVNTHRGKL